MSESGPNSNPSSGPNSGPDSGWRPAGPFDVALLAELNHRCFAAAEGFAGAPWSARSFAEVLALPGAFGLIALCGPDHPAGFALVQVVVDEAELLTLGILPTFRRSGRGGLLLRAALGGAAQRGATRIQLEVAANNLAAQTLYRRAGFQAAGRRRNYYLDSRGARLDALLLARPLTAAAGWES